MNLYNGSLSGATHRPKHHQKLEVIMAGASHLTRRQR